MLLMYVRCEAELTDYVIVLRGGYRKRRISEVLLARIILL